MISKQELYRKLPSVDELVRSPGLASLIANDGSVAVTDAARLVLAKLRREVASGNLDAAGVELAVSGIPEAIQRQLRQSLSYSLCPVINATGVILHTNLGRAPLAATAIEHIREMAASYSNLEFDLDAGERGKRDIHLKRLFGKLLAEDAQSVAMSTIVVNNNAAAVLLALNTFAEGGEVIVSRGELVEIGGSFRIPDVMSKSQAVLREVGTTNRTRIGDYEKAINDKTRLILRVHRSNFEITGFTEQPSLAQLVSLARKHDLPLMEDLGSGSLFDLSLIGISDEPGVLDSLRAGVDVVSFSGDKLLGGPQAGILSGRGDLITQMRGNSLFRALRVDKLTYSALEATLLAYVKHDYDSLPVLRMMRLTKQEIRERAEVLVGKIQSDKVSVEIVDGESVIGGGAAPTAVLPSWLLAVTVKKLTADELMVRLRACDPPILARVDEGRVLLDLRTVFPEQGKYLEAALKNLVQ